MAQKNLSGKTDGTQNYIICSHPLWLVCGPCPEAGHCIHSLPTALFDQMLQPDQPSAGIRCPSPPGGPGTARSQIVLPVLQPLLWLAAPMLLGQAGQVLLQLTDTVMLGHVGPVPLAGAALAGNFVMFALYFAYGALGAVSPRIAGAFGAGANAEAARTMRAGVLLALVIGLAIALALAAVAPFLGQLGQPPEVAASCRGYLLLIACSLPAALIAVVLGQVAEAVDRPWPVLGFMGAAVAFNAGLNWLLIFGHWGCPALGLEGAGWATLAARWLHAAGLAAWICLDRGMRPFWRVPVGRSVFALTGQLFRQGLPVAAQDVVEGGSFAAGSLMLGWAGTMALAANQVTIGIASLAWMIPVSLSMATGVRVAQAAGAGDIATARRTGIAGVAMGAGLMAACALVYTTSGGWLARCFTDDEEVARLASTLVAIAGIYQISDGIQSVSLGALRGLMDNRVPLVANLICYWGLSLPTVYLLAFHFGWGAAGVWAGYLPWMVLTGLFFLWRFLRLTRAGGPLPASTTSR